MSVITAHVAWQCVRKRNIFIESEKEINHIKVIHRDVSLFTCAKRRLNQQKHNDTGCSHSLTPNKYVFFSFFVAIFFVDKT